MTQRTRIPAEMQESSTRSAPHFLVPLPQLSASKAIPLEVHHQCSRWFNSMDPAETLLRVVGRPVSFLVPNDARLVLNDSRLVKSFVDLLPNKARLLPNDARLAKSFVDLLPKEAHFLPNDARLVKSFIDLLPNEAGLLRNSIDLLWNDINLLRNEARLVKSLIDLVPNDSRLLPNVIDLLNNRQSVSGHCSAAVPSGEPARSSSPVSPLLSSAVGLLGFVDRPLFFRIRGPTFGCGNLNAQRSQSAGGAQRARPQESHSG